MYMFLSSYFQKFEEKMTLVRNFFFEYLLLGVLHIANFFNEMCMTRISSERLLELRTLTEKMDLDLCEQIRLCGHDVNSSEVSV